MTMNQVVLGFEWGSIRAFRANASSLTTPRPSVWMTWPVSPTVPGGPSGRRLPDPEPPISIACRRRSPQPSRLVPSA